MTSLMVSGRPRTDFLLYIFSASTACVCLPFFAFFHGATHGCGGFDQSPEPLTLNPTPYTPTHNQNHLSTHQGMGFDRPAVLQALQQTGNDSYAAVNVLVARAGAGSAPGSAGEAVPRGAGAATTAMSPGRGVDSFSEDPHHRHAN